MYCGTDTTDSVKKKREIEFGEVPKFVLVLAPRQPLSSRLLAKNVKSSRALKFDVKRLLHGT